jgi:hypothetical protein
MHNSNSFDVSAFLIIYYGVENIGDSKSGRPMKYYQHNSRSANPLCSLLGERGRRNIECGTCSAGIDLGDSSTYITMQAKCIVIVYYKLVSNETYCLRNGVFIFCFKQIGTANNYDMC